MKGYFSLNSLTSTLTMQPSSK